MANERSRGAPRILIVDDNVQDRYLLREILATIGASVEEAGNGREALERAKASPPDLVISDGLMPVMDGFTLCREWVHDEKLKSIPFVFYTSTYTDAEDAEFAVSLGAVRFLHKPTEPAELVKIIEEVLAEPSRDPQRVAQDEAEVLKTYSERLVAKLEAKVLELERAKRELEGDVEQRIAAHASLQDSETRYRTMAETTDDGIFVSAPDGRLVDVNRAASLLTGFSREELLSMSVFDLSAVGPTEAQFAEAWNSMPAGGARTVEDELCRKDGGRRPVEIRLNPMTLDGDRLLLGVARDLTARRRAEAEIRSMARFPDENPGPVMRIAGDGEVLYMNDASRPVLAAREECDERRVRGECLELVQRVLSTGQRESTEVDTPDEVYLLTFAPIRDEGYVSVYGQRITGRKRAEAARAESERRLKEAQEIAHLGHWVLDVGADLLVWSEETYRIFEKDPLSFAPSYETFLAAVHPDDREAVAAAWSAALEGEPYRLEHRVLVEDGVKWVRTQARMELAEDGHVLRGVGTIADITESRVAEIARRESEERLRSIIEQSIDGIVLVDSEGVVVEWNRGQERITGIPAAEARGKPFWEVQYQAMPSENRAAHLLGVLREATETMLGGGTPPWDGRFMELEIERPDGESRTIQVGAFRIELPDRAMMGSVTRDITEQKQAEDELRAHRENLERLVAERTEAMNTAIEAANAAMFRRNLSTDRVEHDDRWYEMIGIAKEEFEGTFAAWRRLVHPDDLPDAEARIAEALASRRNDLTHEYRILRPDGEVRHIESHSRFLRDETGKPTATVGMTIDITERRKADAALRENEAYLRTLIESMPIDLFSIDRDLRYTMQSPASRASLGDVVGKRIADVDVPQELGVRWIEQQHRVLNGESLRQESELRTSDGTMRTYLTQLAPVRVGDEIIASIGTSMDITERKETERELKGAKALAEDAAADARRFRLLADASGLGIGMARPDGQVVYANPALLSYIGEPDVEAVSRHAFREYYDADSQVRIRDEILPALLDRGQWQGELRLVSRDGTERPTLDNFFAIRDEAGNPILICDVITDLTEQKAAEARLRKLSQAVQGSPASVVITDVDGRIEYVNPKFSETTGYTPEEVYGRNPRLLKAGDQPESFYRGLWETILSGGEWRGEFCNKKKDGELYWELASISPIRGEHGGITHFVAIKEDITERKHAAWELEQATRDAEAANQAKSEFLANMSHELRTPLNAVIGFSEVLQDGTFGELNDRQQRYVGNILDSGRHLLALINDILDLSKVEAGKMELQLGDVDVSRTLFESLVFVQESAQRHRIHLQTTLSDDVNASTVRADERKLKQILYNLLSNAVKFTADGGTVEIAGELRDEELRIRVSDSGIGIAPEHLQRVFDEFEQIDSSYAKPQQGTGLGLALTRRMVELHGGRIWAESEGEGKGSAFTFTIPLMQRETEEGDRTDDS